jgi:hypothetical protein
VAFVRRKGNALYLVHNVRRGGKVRQLHLARLGTRARITDDLVREVSKKHPFVELNWKALRAQLNGQVDLANPNSPTVQKLVSSLRALTLDLADVFPPILRLSESPVVARELLVQLRLLQSTIHVKLEQFGRARGRFSHANPSSRVR